MTRLDRYTNTPEDAAEFERAHATDDRYDDRPTAAELAGEDFAMPHVPVGTRDLVLTVLTSLGLPPRPVTGGPEVVIDVLEGDDVPAIRAALHTGWMTTRTEPGRIIAAPAVLKEHL